MPAIVRLNFASQIDDDLNPVFNWKAGPFTWNGFDPVNVRCIKRSLP
jgi:hypothetical protein